MSPLALLLGFAASASAFAPATLRTSVPVSPAAAANAEIDYAGVGFLGGSNIIDVNNANIRVYAKLPGMYPNVAGKLVKNAPYKSAAEVASKAGLNTVEASTFKKYESRFIFLEPKPEYVMDAINNGLYR